MIYIDPPYSIGKDFVYPDDFRNLTASLDEAISRNDVKPRAFGLADWHDEPAPVGGSMVAFRDSAFADDVAKTNLAEILKQRGIRNIRAFDTKSLGLDQS